MGMSGGGKGQGGPMPNPGFGGFQPGMGYAGGNPNFNEMQPGRIGSPGPTMPNPGFGPPPMMSDRDYAGGDPGFSERMDPTMPAVGAGGNPQVIGQMLKRWDGNGVLPNQPGVPDAPPMGYQQGSGQLGGQAAVGVPGMAAGNFGAAGQSGNASNAIFNAIATGNQSGLNGQGSQATNSDINANQSGGGGNSQNYLDWYQQNQARLNRQGPAYQAGGIFGPK